MNKYWLILVVAAVAGSAVLRVGAAGQPDLQDEIQRNHERWQARHITHYRYALEISCLCGFKYEPYTFEVKNGKVLSALDGLGQPISDADIDAPPHSVDWFYGLTTIDSLFDYVEQVSSQADEVQITYDSEDAYPTSIQVDWSAAVIGDEIGLHVINFESLP